MVMIFSDALEETRVQLRLFRENYLYLLQKHAAFQQNYVSYLQSSYNSNQQDSKISYILYKIRILLHYSFWNKHNIFYM